MIEHATLFLGLLADGPKHGYEIKRIIDQELYPLMGLQVKSVYYPLQKLEHMGLIRKDSGREGKFPEKFVYSLTPQGIVFFRESMLKRLFTVERPFFEIDLSLYFLHHVPSEPAQRKLKARIAFLKRINRQLESLIEQGFAGRSPYWEIILQHNLDLIDAETRSLSRLITLLHKDKSLSMVTSAHHGSS